MTNHRTAAELKVALDVIVAELKAFDMTTITDAERVLLTKSLQDVAWLWLHIRCANYR